MNRLKKINLLIILTVILSALTFTTKVCAAASAVIGISGNSTANMGSNITVKMYVSNVVDTIGGVSSVSANLKFDSDYLEYVSGTGVSTPYTFQINPSNNYIIAGLDTTLSNGITGSGQVNVMTFVFRPKQEGTTQITLTNNDLTDTVNQISSTVRPLTITIGAPIVKNGDATLKSLGVSGYTMSPAFSPSVTSYKVTVPYTAAKVTVTGAVNNSKSRATGIGDYTINKKTTSIPITVTAEDGTTKTYTITVEREDAPVIEVPKSNDATLKSLTVKDQTLDPTFKSNISTYAIKVKNDVTSLDISAIANHEKAKVEITGNKDLKEGVNTVSIKVTAEDGSVNNYTINVTREEAPKTENPTTEKPTTTPKPKSSDSYLKSMLINSSHEISPKFNKNISSYNVTVPYEVDKLDLNYSVSNSKAKVKVTGNENFKVGEVNTVEIEVTAEDGSKRYYILNVTRSTKESENDLKELIVKDAPLSPSFKPDVLEYTTKVPSNVDKLDIIATAKTEGSKVEIIGNENLKEGKNTILVKVTDKNGFSKYYTINVEKEAKQKSNSILGLTPLQFGIMAGITGILLTSLISLIVLLIRAKKVPKSKTENENQNFAPVIEIKPEFNFSSKNTSDDDVVHGDLNQDSSLLERGYEPKRKAIEAIYEDKSYDTPKSLNYSENEVPYDPYDDIVTKDEIIDALYEATETNDASKLQMLLEQDRLNKQKEEMKQHEEAPRRRSDRYEDM